MVFLVLVLAVPTFANSLLLVELLKRSGDILSGMAGIMETIKGGED